MLKLLGRQRRDANLRFKRVRRQLEYDPGVLDPLSAGQAARMDSEEVGECEAIYDPSTPLPTSPKMSSLFVYSGRSSDSFLTLTVAVFL